MSQVVGMLERQPYDVVVVDLMPDPGDGFGIIRTIKSRWSAVRVIVVSSSYSVEIPEAAFRSGAEAYFVYPYHSEEFKG